MAAVQGSFGPVEAEEVKEVKNRSINRSQRRPWSGAVVGAPVVWDSNDLGRLVMVLDRGGPR